MSLVSELRNVGLNCISSHLSTHASCCCRYHKIHKEVYDWFDISFDEFGRTSIPQHTEVCQAIFKKLMENNWLSENRMQQLYCETCQRFLADRLVEGTCPTLDCNYDSARGDQCEKCGKLLNPTELKDPRCKVCQSTPQIRDTDHLFLELPLLKDKLEEYINNMSIAGCWSQNAIQATYAWLKEGLRSRCITRDLKWGVPVPHEKYKDKVFYVWFDAPIGYVSITACYTPEWEKWWKNPENVDLYQFMGKDNVPFHTVMFPSTLIGTGENWTLMKSISVTEYLNYEAGKFSKSKGVGVFGNDVKDTKIPAEVWRYYLLTNRPEVSDSLFTWVDLQAKLNTELLNNLGNFINRVLSFIAKAPGLGYGSSIPDAPGAESHYLTKALAEKVGAYLEQYIEAMEKVKLKQGLKIGMSISSEGNGYLQESQFWKLYKEDRASCSIVMRTSVGLVYLLSCLLEPFMPSFSLEVLKQLNLPPETRLSLCDENGDLERARKPWELLPAGHKMGTPEPLLTIDGNGKKQKSTKSGSEVQIKKSCKSEVSISRLDIRVGLIKKLRNIRMLTPFITEKSVVLCNLKPATMRGVNSSNGSCSDKNGTKVELLEPPHSASVGERVTFPGFEGKPDRVLNPKKKIWETLQSDLHTDAQLFAFYKDVPFTTSAGVCKVQSISNGVIS
ncbi:putative methionine--tRNA ligase [Vitis vinifera]|uniref:methionine--tRNA ligase n=1 Tax=Vitis vinifera TaxID=29760 RepID=A0A438G783_VITVI|nr:putative methionine--tRNA ligase [Vitis vinifera]